MSRLMRNNKYQINDVLKSKNIARNYGNLWANSKQLFNT